MIILIAFSLYFVAGANLIHVGLALLTGVAGALALIMAVGDYPLKRIQTLVDPWAEPQGAGYQTIKGLEALSAGTICSPA